MAFVEGNEKYRINRLQKNLKITFETTEIPNAQEVLVIRLKKWSEKILNSKPTVFDKKLTALVNENLEELSKEELIQKLIAIELEGLSLTNTKNLNQKEREGGNRSKRPRGGKPSRFSRDRSKSKSPRKFSSKRGEKNQTKSKTRSFKAGKRKAKR